MSVRAFRALASLSTLVTVFAGTMASTASAAARTQPSLYISHGGGPCFFFDAKEYPMFAGMDKHSPTAKFLRGLRASLPESPRAIVVVSAHWEEAVFTVGLQDSETDTELLYDYYGFPDESYNLAWKPKFSRAVAARVQDALQNAGLPVATARRGYDHGVFVPLSVAFPEGDVPIIQLSLKRNLSTEEHIQLGVALAPLREEGILIIGSGALTHNLGELRGVFDARPNDPPVAWAADFQKWVAKTLLEPKGNDVYSPETRQKLVNILEAPGARKSHPREEHLIPLHVAFGAGVGGSSRLERSSSSAAGSSRVHEAVVKRAFCMDAYRFD